MLQLLAEMGCQRIITGLTAEFAKELTDIESETAVFHVEHGKIA